MTEKIPLTPLETVPDNETMISIMKLSDELFVSARHDNPRDMQLAIYGETSNTSLVPREVKDGKRFRPRKIDNLSIVDNTVLVGREIVRSINIADKPDLRLRTFLPIVDITSKHVYELDESNPSYSVDVIKYWGEDDWKTCAKDTRYIFEFNSDSFAYAHDPSTENIDWAKLDREFEEGELTMPERLHLFLGRLSVPTYTEYQSWLDKAVS